MTRIVIPKKDNYRVPEGRYQAYLRDVLFLDKSHKRSEDTIRLVFQITSLTHPLHNYVAGKDYKESMLSMLAHDLETWMGCEIESLLVSCQDNEDAVELSKDALKALEGREADIEVIHNHVKGWDTPYRNIQQIKPRGTMIIELDKKIKAA